MLSEALAFPRRDGNWLTTVLIGGVLSLFGFLVLPAIVVNGYLLRVMRAAIEGAETPPTFERWVDLFVDGLLVWVVELVYVGVPSVVLALVVAVAFGAGAVGRGVGALLVALIGVVLLVAAYVLPAALGNLARTGEFAAAFHLRTVAGAAFTADYVVAVVLAIAVSLVLGVIGGLLTIILVGIFVLFFLQVVVYHLFGQGYARGLNLEPTADASAEVSD